MDHAQQSDGALLAAFLEAGEAAAREAAFAELVRRHGAMVLNACRRIVGTNGDAEDAAQAVFITLAHKARSLRGHPTLGGWLHRAARNIALRQRDALRARARHEAHEEARAMTSPPDGLDERLRGELREELDGALDRLAERYRLPLVLHYLEGRSQEEVAQLLALNPGTLASLLSRGRDLLRAQLQRKGVAVSALALAGLLVGEAQAATATTVPAAFTLAASHAAAGATIAPHVLALTHGAMKTMTIIKLTGAAVAAAVVLTVGAASVVSLRAPGAEQPAAVVAAPFDDATPEALVASAVHAVRINDIAAFWRRLPAAEQQRMQDGYARFTGNQWMTQMIERALGQLTPDQIKAVVVPALTQIDTGTLSTHLRQFAVPTEGSDPNAGGGPGGFGRGGVMMVVEGLTTEAVGGVLASGLETQQAQSLTALLGAFAEWTAKAPLADQAKANACAGELGAAIAALGVKSADDLTSLTVAELANRLGGGAQHLKTALAAYELQIDAALDTVAVAEVKPIAGTTDQVVATLRFTAFGAARTLPLKLVKRSGHWSVANDSPLTAWLRARGPNLFALLGFGGGRGGPGGPGGRGRGQGGQGGQGGQPGQPGQPAQPTPPPANPNPGF